ncbi:MAG: hypothetical protein GY851_37000 [bacterium]|nr:hypothetical protein [bacterium]
MMLLMRPAMIAMAIAMGAAHAAEEPPVKWTAPHPDPEKPHAGLPLVSDAEHILIYKAQPDPGTYNHGPKIVHHDDVFTVIWYSHAKDEDSPGQRILYSASPDGRTWSPAAPMFDSLSPMRDAGSVGVMMWPRGFQLVDGRLYAYGSVAEIAAWTDHMRTGQVEQGDKKKHNVPVRRRLPPLLRRVANGHPEGSPFWLDKTSPEGHDAIPPCASCDETTQRDVAEVVRREMTANIGSLPEPAEKARLCEAIHYMLDDGQEVRLFRDDLYSLRMFASLRPTASQPWPPAVKTNIPDSPSLSCVGRLPDGQFFLIGNHLPKQWRRDPLTLALSRDGLDYDRAWAIRSGAPPITHKGLHKGVGYQYPDAIVVDDDLWVAYSIGKEDIAVSRVPVSTLKAE